MPNRVPSISRMAYVFIGVFLGIANLGCEGSVTGNEDHGGGAAPAMADGGGIAQGTDSGTYPNPGSDAGPVLPSDPLPTGDDPFPRGTAEAVFPATTLPAAPPLYVRAWEVLDDSASFQVFPVTGAADYRIYPLPDDGDVALAGDDLDVEDGVFRCAGDRFGYPVASDGDATELTHWYAVTTTVQGEVDGFDRSSVDETLGYVALSPGDGLVPLFAMGSPHEGADHSGEALRSPETRAKRYVTGDRARTTFMAAGWRDDGLVGYVPAADAGGAHAVQVSADDLDPERAHGSIYYFADAAEARNRGGAEIAFGLFDGGAPDRAALGRVHFRKWGTGHDELVVGAERLAQIQREGVIPLLSLQWPNVAAGQVLVLEALDRQCPFQGNITANDGAAHGTLLSTAKSLTAARAGAAHGEVFLNGQGEAGNRPRVLARTFMRVAPGASTIAWDWENRFSEPPSWSRLTGENEQWASPVFATPRESLHFQFIDAAHVGVSDGELWLSLMDAGASTNGKFRYTPLATTTVDRSSYLHATMTVDFFSSDRRYPQMFITDQRVAMPIQASPGGDGGQNLEAGAGILIQGFGDAPTSIQVQYCDGRPWDVNNQCPLVDLEQPLADDRWPSGRPVKATGSLFYRNRVDAFVSAARVYVFLDGRPYGCADLPGTFSYRDGESRVSFGHVLYHSGIDVEGDAFPFHGAHQKIVTQRRFDNLAFRAGAEVPSWPVTLSCHSDWN